MVPNSRRITDYMLLGHYRQQSPARATTVCRISKHLLLISAARFETAMYCGERRSSKSAISLAAFTAPARCTLLS
jgi:hypothetical protein